MTAAGNYIVESDVDNWAALAVNYASKTTIAFVASNRTITDSADGFVTALFKANMRIDVSGSINNDGKYTISSVVAGTITLTAADSLTDEAAGATITITSGERQEAIERVEDWIERLTHDYFYAAAFDVYRDGNREDRLNLGLLPDILSITSVAVHGIALDTSWYTNDAHHIYLDPNEAYASESAELHFRTKYKQGLFPKGRSNIRIVGTYGWSICPSAIKQAAVMLCRYENDSSLYQEASVEFKSERLGDYAYTRFDASEVPILSGVSIVDKWLRQYIRSKPHLGAA